MYHTLSWPEFEKVEMHVGTILTAEDFPKAKSPAYKLTIDFGLLGIKRVLHKLQNCTVRKSYQASRSSLLLTFHPNR